MIKGVIFDFDNTLYNYDLANDSALKITFNYICSKYNKNLEVVEETYLILNKQIKNSNNPSNKFNKPIYFKLLFERLNISLKFLSDCLQLYNNTFIEYFKLYDYVIEFFIFLKSKDIKIAIVSNNNFYQQYSKLQETTLIDYIDLIITSDECGEEKPQKNMFISMQNNMNIPFENLAYIGDNYEHDIEPSLTFGMLPFLFKKNISFSLIDKIVHFGNFKDLNLFFKDYFDAVDELIFLSKNFGQSTLNVQGPGGNISVKLQNLLFIKSSGCILGNVSYDNGYCIINNDECNKIIQNNLPLCTFKTPTSWVVMSEQGDADCAFSICNGANKVTKIYGYKTPSMETYFHSFMKKYVVHLHFVLSNIILCSTEIPHFEEFELSYKIIDYCIPGLELAKEIKKNYSELCDVYFLKNHGLIITSDTIENIFNYYEYIFKYFNKKLDTNYNEELICNKIMRIYHKYNCLKVVKTINTQTNLLEHIIVCFPDLAIFIQKKCIINSLEDLEKNFDEYDLIIYKKKVYAIADNITKLYSLIEIINSYCILLSSSKSNLQSIDNITKLQNMEEEKLRRL